MNDKIRLFCLFFSFLFSISSTFAQKLVIYNFNPRNPDENDKSAGYITINFYPDGLIKSFKESYFVDGKQNREVLSAFSVSREGNTIKQEYIKNANNFKLATYQILGDSIIINRPLMKPGERSEIRRERVLVPRKVIYNRSFNGKIMERFTFTPAYSSNDYFGNGTEIYIYEVDSSTGLPFITVKKMGNEINIFEIERITNIKTFITVNSENGPPTRSYRIEGVPKHSKPEIAIINYFLFDDDPIFPLSIFPYIGGCPEESEK